MAWSELDRVDDIGELSTETNIDKVPEGGLGVFVKVLIPEPDPILETNSPWGLIVSLNGLIIGSMSRSVTLIYCLFEDVPGAYTLLRRRKDFFNSRNIDSFGPRRRMKLENSWQEH